MASWSGEEAPWALWAADKAISGEEVEIPHPHSTPLALGWTAPHWQAAGLLFPSGTRVTGPH